MDFWRSIAGEVEAELICAEPQLLLKNFNSAGIELRRIEFIGELTCRFRLGRRDFHHAEKIARSAGGKMRPLRNRGLFFRLRQLLHRPVLVAGLCIMLAAVLFLPTRVFFFEVEGNERVPTRKILEAAANSGIRFGASRRHLRSEQVKNALLGAIPELQWAGINTRGCVAIVSVRERTPEEPVPRQDGICSMVALRDGYILSATATRGELLVQPGQTIAEGDILISGYRDLGGFFQACGAEGEVFAQTGRDLTVVTPAHWQSLRETGATKKKISLLLGKKRINLWKDSGISGVSCGRMYEEYYVTLPGGFALPVALCVERFDFRDTAVESMDMPNPDDAMKRCANDYLLSQMIAGQIRSSEEQWLLTDSLLVLRETYVCHEMIGRFRQEQIGDIHE